jgi:uncharacterized protein YjiS (DUF1127 family)
MNTMFHPFRQASWSGLKRYFVEWRKRALLRRELSMLSNRECEDIGLNPTYRDDARRWF